MVIFVVVFQHDLINHFIWREPSGGETPIISLLCFLQSSCTTLGAQWSEGARP